MSDPMKKKKRKQTEKLRAQNKRRCLQWRINNPFDAMFHNAQKRAAKRGVPFALTATDIEAQWIKQDGKCDQGGCPIVLLAGQAVNAGQLDCTVPDLGYVPENVVFLCAPHNRQKDVHTWVTALRLSHYLWLKKFQPTGETNDEQQS